MPDDKGAARVDEQDLLQRARKLDESALSSIFDAYFEPLYRYIYRHIGVSFTAEDLAAEVFRSLLEELSLGRGPTTYLRAWMYRVAHNLIVDELRRNKHRDHEPLDEDRQAADATVADQAQKSMDQQMTQRALQQLTEKQRSVLVLRYIHGLEIEEVAETLSMSSGTVKALQHRGLQALRRYLRKNGILDVTDL